MSWSVCSRLLRNATFSNFTMANRSLLSRAQRIHTQQALTALTSIALPRKRLYKNYSTDSTSEAEKQPGVFSRLLRKMGYEGAMRYNKARMNMAGFRLYMCCEGMVDYDLFRTELDMPDTFNSWFMLTELHIWMIMVRLAQEDREGLYVRNALIKALWEDIDKRTRMLGNLAGSAVRRKGINEFGQHFRASLYSYDEGVLGDDRVLASAVWRTLFQMQQDSPQRLELMVEYIRKQLCHLNGQESQLILEHGMLTLLPLHGTEIDQIQINSVLKSVSGIR